MQQVVVIIWSADSFDSSLKLKLRQKIICEDFTLEVFFFCENWFQIFMSITKHNVVGQNGNQKGTNKK